MTSSKSTETDIRVPLRFNYGGAPIKWVSEDAVQMWTQQGWSIAEDLEPRPALRGEADPSHIAGQI